MYTTVNLIHIESSQSGFELIRSSSQENSKKPKILVVGDCILDQYFWTKVSRISPEAPVPICHIQNTNYRLGGAGNVANNLAAFDAEVSLIGVIGNDANGDILMSELKKVKINSEMMIRSDKIPTISKARVIAKNQQLLRLDHEDPLSNFDEHVQIALKKINQSLDMFDCVVISDYLKGIVTKSFSTQLIENANKKQVPIVVDPKGKDISKYYGATFFTPNMSEFSIFSNLKSDEDENEIINKGKQLILENNINHLILTRSEKGMTIITNKGNKNYPTKAKEVADVTGAGDTVVAAIAYGISQKWTNEEIINFANHAAGVVVSKVGTATATLDEIKEYEANL